MIVEFIDWLRTGELGSIKLGMNFQDAEIILGKPQDEARFKIGKGRWGKIYKYEDLELTVVDGRIILMQIDFNPFGEHRVVLPDAVQIAGINRISQTTMTDFDAYLAEHQISYAVDPALTFDSSQTCLLLESGIRAIFDKEDRICILSQSELQ